MTFFAVVGLVECVRIMEFENSWEKYAVYPISGMIWYQFSVKFFNQSFAYDFKLAEILSLSLIGIAIFTLFKYKNELNYNNGKLIFSVIYVTMCFGYGLAIARTDKDIFFSLEPFFLFILIWCSDTFAYVMGRIFGKTKMAPIISPKKTWEGFIGGILLTLVFSIFIELNFENLRGNWIIVGGLVAFFAPMGDLVESMLKRIFLVKDSGKIIPGHGGILDRLDSFMICAPVLYLYFILDKFFF